MFDSKPPQAATKVAARTIVARAAVLHGGGEEHAVVDVEIDDLGFVGDRDAEVLGGADRAR